MVTQKTAMEITGWLLPMLYQLLLFFLAWNGVLGGIHIIHAPIILQIYVDIFKPLHLFKW